MALLKAEDLTCGYNAGDVLRGVSISIEAGELVAVLGINGAGKSTLMKAVMGLIPSRSGSLSFKGEDITRSSPPARVRKGLALVPEGREVFASLTVEENLLLGNYARFRRWRPARDDMTEIFEIFPRLKERRHQLGGDLSGGEQQMLALGRALMSKPECLLVDELSLGLAPAIVLEIYERLRAAAETRGLAICLVEQSTEIALEVAARGYVLRDGQVVSSGATAEIANDEELVAAYLGARAK